VNTAEYAIERLAALGITHCFGVPGDYSFPIDNAVENSKNMKWVGSTNELNAAYEADGYARIKGVALCSTTFAVGELSALNGIMGAKAERLVVFHFVGHPAKRIQRARALTHHTLGDGDFNYATPLSTAATCIAVELTPTNVHLEMERAITTAVANSRPAYIYVSQDLAEMQISAEAAAYKSEWKTLDQVRAAVLHSVPHELEAAVEAIKARLTNSKKPIAFVSFLLHRYGLADEALKFLKAANIPYVSMPMDKGVLDETAAPDLYLGMSCGFRTPVTTSLVKDADLVIDLGGVSWVDLNCMAWTHGVDTARLITLGPHHTHVPLTAAPIIGSPDASYAPVFLGDVLKQLSGIKSFATWAKPAVEQHPAASTSGKLLNKTLYPTLNSLLKEGDILFSETGTCTFSTRMLTLPKGAVYYNQTLYGSIGWATPAAIGAAIAAPDRRVVLVTGDGSHNLTLQSLCEAAENKVSNLICLVLNNALYGIEELLAEKAGHAYDDLPKVNYSLLPAAFGCDDWVVKRCLTMEDFVAAWNAIQGKSGYLELMQDAEDHPMPMAEDVLYGLYHAYPTLKFKKKVVAK